MLRKRFFIAWAAALIAMVGISWLWHGVVLNDLIFVPQPYALFYGIALFTYSVIAFGLTFLYTYLSMGLHLKLKGSLMGIGAGFCIYLIAFVFGISFKGSGTEHIVLDFVWQMLEQGVGGTVIAVVYAMAHNYDLSTGALDRKGA